MRRNPLLALAGLSLALGGGLAAGAQAGGEIYGTVITTHGETYSGPIRWDKNENFWDDMLDASKDKEIKVKHERRKEVRIFGLQISRSGITTKVRSEFSIPFGHISSVTPLRRNRVELELKNGDLVRVRESSDIGDGMRGLVIQDEASGEVDLDWHSVERIDFAPNPGRGYDDQRLYGTVETRRAKFTGFIVWDKDESLREDILDGEDDGRKYKIPFAKIHEIIRRNSRSSEVKLATGRSVVLSGTNDVDDDNRGIVVSIPDIGSVEIDWDAFRRVVFADAPPSPLYSDFDGGRPLYGVVTDAGGREYEGEIIWDNDERYTFEPLDGDTADVDFAILFENIAFIERESDEGAAVTLLNGNVFMLEDSNDVDEENKGILIKTSNGEEVELDWDSFRKVEFANR